MDNELKNLGIFEGEWNVEGKNFDISNPRLTSQVSGTVSYSWLEGHQFLVCNWNRGSQNKPFTGIGIIGQNAKSGSLQTDNFDNLGFHQIYTIENHNLTWKFSGATERAQIVFNDNGENFSEEWQIKKDETWQPLCQLNATKKTWK